MNRKTGRRHLSADKYIATFYLVLMCVQILWMEGWEVSPLKVGAMCAAPLVMAIRRPAISKATVLGGLYLLWIFLCAYLQWDHPRIETMGYRVMFVVTFIMFYNLVYGGAFTIDFAIKLLSYLMIAYSVCQIGQQLFIMAGIRNFPALNLVNQHYLSVFKVNSLSIEPSHSARILTVCCCALFKLTEYKCGYVPTLKKRFAMHKWTIILFLYAMLSMGSGTAIIGLGILMLYFVKKQYVAYLFPLLLILHTIGPMIDYTPLNRARVATEAAMQGENKTTIEADGSAAVRIVPMLNTVRALDLTQKEAWFGHGIDTELKEKLFSTKKMVGGITDYGLVSWFLSLILVFACCIRRPMSVETLIFIVLLSAGINNIAYQWGALMLLAVIKYFDKTLCCEKQNE